MRGKGITYDTGFITDGVSTHELDAFQKDAIQLARRIDQAKLAETDRWEKLSSSTNFDDSEEHRWTHLGLPQASQETTK